MEKNQKESLRMELVKVGEVRSELTTPNFYGCDSETDSEERIRKLRESHEKIKNLISEIIIYPEWEELLQGIEAFSHILVLFWPHLLDQERRKVRKVHPMGRKELPEQGIFATCSPARPNPVLITAVQLLELNGNKLKVKGFEALDGTPVIDIKPYSKHYHKVDNPVVPDWMLRIHQDLGIDI